MMSPSVSGTANATTLTSGISSYQSPDRRDALLCGDVEQDEIRTEVPVFRDALINIRGRPDHQDARLTIELLHETVTVNAHVRDEENSARVLSVRAFARIRDRPLRPLGRGGCATAIRRLHSPWPPPSRGTPTAARARIPSRRDAVKFAWTKSAATVHWRRVASRPGPARLSSIRSPKQHVTRSGIQVCRSTSITPPGRRTSRSASGTTASRSRSARCGASRRSPRPGPAGRTPRCSTRRGR